MSLTATVQLSVAGQQTNPVDLGTAKAPFSESLSIAYASGVAAGQADRVFHDQRTLAASATENLDLAGILADVFGAVLTFATIKAIIIRAASGNTNDVQVTRPAANGVVGPFLAAGDGVALKPGFAFAWFGSGAGVAVTPATGDLLTITNSAAGTPVTYDVIIIGTSA